MMIGLNESKVNNLIHNFKAQLEQADVTGEAAIQAIAGALVLSQELGANRLTAALQQLYFDMTDKNKAVAA